MPTFDVISAESTFSPVPSSHAMFVYYANYAFLLLAGNLKHKDLTGHVVSSQAYVDEQNENGVEDCEDTVVEDQHISPVIDDEQETK